MEIKVCTFNIRKNCDTGLQAFENRLPLVVDFIKEQKPDIIGFQEVMPEVKEMLMANMPDYVFYGAGRMADGSEESVPLAILKDKFRVLFYESFWISDTPDVPGSRAFDCYWPRVCTKLILETVNEGVKFCAYNVHLDHKSEPARQLGAKIIMDKTAVDKADNIPTMVMGDFNAFPDSLAVKDMISDKGVKFTDLTDQLEYTFNDWLNKKEKIDYIFVSDGIKGKIPASIYKKVNEAGTCISDHWPVLVTVELD